ncbi:MAG: mechanosensitive ion channel [Burkholderiales bacterium]|jgi:small-conductance mechanosensitive channel|nr:mechanosensitive ion channel [Burkholderiales bacterium]
MSASAEFHGLLLDLWGDLQNVKILWQVGVLAACILVGWLLSRRYNLRVLGHVPLDATQALGIGSMQRLLFPLSTLVLVMIAKSVLRHWQSTHLLNVAAALLLAMALIRISIYIMRHTFAPSPWLRASERWISWLAWIGVAVYLTGLWPFVRDALLDINFAVGKQKFSLLLVLQGSLSVIATLLVALWLGRLAEVWLMRATTLQVNLRVMFSKLVQVLLLLAAFLIALPAVGIDLTVLSVFGGMLGVGIGFGLQKIAANYISGFIILMDRSVSIGDVVTIGEHTGTLTQMTARYVVVRGLGGLEALIPNETIITSTVVNHSFSDRNIRVALPIQVAYASDLDAARKIMVDVATKHPRVLKDPEPGVLITAFADSGINLELGVWVDDPDQGLASLRSDLYAEIWRAFREQGIEIPFPQREVRIVGEIKSTPEK